MALLDLLLPPACAACGRYGAVLCAACRASLRAPSAAADRFLAADAAVVLGDALVAAVAAFAYEGAARGALQKLKYGGARRVAEPLALAALPALRRLTQLCGPLPLVPIPLHADRRRERGYNQAALLADALARGAGLPRADLLQRPRPTTRQHRLDRAARLRNLRGAFVVAPTASPMPTAVILVDDILTTSATLEACAAALRGAGMREVYGFAVAREV